MGEHTQQNYMHTPFLTISMYQVQTITHIAIKNSSDVAFLRKESGHEMVARVSDGSEDVTTV